MFVVCSVEESKPWQQLKDTSALDSVATLDKASETSASLITESVAPQQLLSFCGSHKNATVVIVVSPLVMQIAANLRHEQANMTGSVATDLEKLLLIQSQNRKQIKLIPLSAIYSGELKTQFPEQLGAMAPVTAESHFSDVEIALAFYLLENDKKLKKLAKQLDASLSISSDDAYLTVDVASVIKEQHYTEQAQTSLEKENSFLIAQLQGVQEAYEAQSDSLRETQNEYKRDQASYSEKISNLKKDISDKSKSLKTHSLELNKLKKEIKSVREAERKSKKASDNKATELTNKLRDSENTGHALRKELAELRLLKQSPYWKASRKIEKIFRVFERNTKNKQEHLLNLSLVRSSNLFDADWYLNTYKDVAAADIDPANHYLVIGAKEGRKPSPFFDGDEYRRRYPDVEKEGINPLIHFIKYGREEGRSASSASHSHKRNG